MHSKYLVKTLGVKEYRFLKGLMGAYREHWHDRAESALSRHTALAKLCLPDTTLYLTAITALFPL